MSSNNDDQNKRSRKRERYSYAVKRRRRSTIVHDPNGSTSTFRLFYQSGGRDYEEYRLWLQTQSQLNQSAAPTMTKDSIKIQDTDIETVMPCSLPLPVHSIKTTLVPRASNTHTLLKSARDVSLTVRSPQRIAMPILSSTFIPTTMRESLNHVPYDYFNNSAVPMSASSSFSLPSCIHWTVTDVGRFIAKHFPDKNLVRKFVQQKIDGRTLPLLTEDHLIRIFKMKLGPALYLLSLISDSGSQN